jgi:hypothetical protein
MEVIATLIVCLSALVTLTTLVWAEGTGRQRPRLRWFFVVATLCGAALIGVPPPSALHSFIAVFGLSAFYAAAGTIIGDLSAPLLVRILGIRP